MTDTDTDTGKLALCAKAIAMDYWRECYDAEMGKPLSWKTPELYAEDNWRVFKRQASVAIQAYESARQQPQVSVEERPETFEQTRSRQLATMDLQDMLAFAKAEVTMSPLFRKFIQGTPLENDIAVWMAEFALRYRIAALTHQGVKEAGE